VTDKFGWVVAIFVHSPPYDYVLKIEQEGHLWCTRTVEITLLFQHTPVHPVQCARESDWAKFEPPWTILADSTAMARCTTAQKCWRGAPLMHPQAINKHLIAAHAIVPCTMRVQGRLGKVLALPDDSGRFYGRGKTGPNTDFPRKNRKIGSRGGIGMGSKSGWAHALGCPEWVPPGAGSREGVLGTLRWFPFPSGPILAIHADTDQIPIHTCLYT
jgi:hypothetical protein